MLRSAEAANAAFPGVFFDDRQLVEAEVRYQQLEAVFPEYAAAENVETRLEGIREQRAEKDLEVAKWYERTRQPGAAEFYYRLILRDWPGTLGAHEARARLRAMGVEIEQREGEA
jgi:outer membrane protein assembly factor BamD (BamD/ComL family)